MTTSTRTVGPQTVTTYRTDGGCQTEDISTKDALKCIAHNVFSAMKSFAKTFLPPATLAAAAGAGSAWFVGEKSDKKIAQVAGILFAGTLGLHITAKLAMRALARH